MRLEPLEAAHAADLLEIGRDEDIFRWLPRGPFAALPDVQAWIDATLRPEADGPQTAFAVRIAAGGRVAGSTRYLAIRPEHRRLEIGWTWYGMAYRRTFVNTACKLLLLRHAFETLGANRVEFKTDVLNTRSQAALERIGAVREGVFRMHRLRRDGTLRDTVWYSIIVPEWLTVRERLAARLADRPAD